jgi:hypothetical protein
MVNRQIVPAGRWSALRVVADGDSIRKITAAAAAAANTLTTTSPLTEILNGRRFGRPTLIFESAQMSGSDFGCWGRPWLVEIA